MPELEELETFLKKAEKKVDQAELYFERQNSTSMMTKLDGIDIGKSNLNRGYSIRVVNDGRLGFSYFSSPSEFDKALKNAIQSAKFSKKLGVSFPPRKKLSEAKGIHNKRVLDLSEEEMSDMLLQMIDLIKRKKVKPLRGSVSKSEKFRTMVNSEGGSFQNKDTRFGASAGALFKESRGHEWFDSHSLFDIDRIAENAASNAISFSSGKSISGNFDIILHPELVSYLISQIFLQAINGERVFRKDSFFYGKLGKKVAPKEITVYDDPLLPQGLNSYPCDDEGVPSTKRPIIEKGILKSFLYNLEISHLTKKKSTGNGFRQSFHGPPFTEITNLVIDSKDKVKLEEFKGILVRDLLAIHNANTLTGDFALEIQSGAFFDGEIKKPIGSCSLVGNFFDILKNVKMGDDFQNYDFYYGPSWIYHGKVV